MLTLKKQIKSKQTKVKSIDQGTLTEGEGSVHLTSSLSIKVACFVKKVKNIFNIKSS
jgi:hypothetical protein